jgi:glycosyltransferase involved in cell wall biosynthesis
MRGAGASPREPAAHQPVRSGWEEFQLPHGCGLIRDAVVAGTPIRAYAARDEAWAAEIVVGVALHDQGDALPACLASIVEQRGTNSIAILILDDASTDDWTTLASPWLDLPGVVVVRSECGTAARARNRILDLADELFPRARWVARLDADDRFADPCSLAAACQLAECRGASYVLGGNRLRRDGALLGRTNPASERLLEPRYVVDLLERMAEGSAENELCSCNLVLGRGSGFRYPEVDSAEDHWLVADLLINHPHAGAILSSPFYCDYTLGGRATRASQRADEYVRSRRALHHAARRWAGTAFKREAACG